MNCSKNNKGGGRPWRVPGAGGSRCVSAGRALAVPALLLMQLLGFAPEAEALGGVSNSKVTVLSADTVPRGVVELEPYFSAEFADDRDNTRKYGGGLRITPGITDFLEAGVSINFFNVEDSDLIRAENDFGHIDSGLKLRLIDEGAGSPFSLAYVAGVTFPVDKGAEWVVEPAGLVLTKNFTDRFSLDADLVVGLIEGGSWSLAANTGLGYYVTPWLQAVVEGAYAFEGADGGGDVSIINVTGGFTANAAEWLTVIVGVTPDIYVKNDDRLVVLTAAFTFAF
ncbi:MAG TPA: hypothetical protein PKC29_04475 [Thermodesulfobacteriota bacterium]|nr:hypothetical protein [Thermodesulfobacteriota bacterium]